MTNRPSKMTRIFCPRPTQPNVSAKIHPLQSVSLFLALVLLALTQNVASGAEASAPGKDTVELRAIIVRATEEQITEAFKPLDNADGNTALLNPEQLKLVVTGLRSAKTRFLADLLTVASGGVDTTAQSIRELPYPTEFKKSETEQGKQIPSAFETRNIGTSVIFSAQVPSGDVVRLAIRAEITDFLGFVDYSGSGNPAPNPDQGVLENSLQAPLTPGGIWQPIFHSVNFQTTADIPSGHTLVLGGAPAGPDPNAAKGTGKGERIYLFITPTILK